VIAPAAAQLSGRVPCDEVAALRSIDSGSTGFDVGVDASSIVLAVSVRHEQPAKRTSQRQRLSRSGCGLSDVGAQGVRVARRRQHTNFDSAVSVSRGRELSGVVEAPPPAQRPSGLKTEYARERDDVSSLTDQGSTPCESTAHCRHGVERDARTRFCCFFRHETAAVRFNFKEAT
jgi:hypothetical protein